MPYPQFLLRLLFILIIYFLTKLDQSVVKILTNITHSKSIISAYIATKIRI